MVQRKADGALRRPVAYQRFLDAVADRIEERGWTQGAGERDGRECLLVAFSRTGELPFSQFVKFTGRIRAEINDVIGEAPVHGMVCFNDSFVRSRRRLIRFLREGR